MLIDAHTILFLIPLVVDLTSCVYSYFRLSTESQQKHEKSWEWKILEEPTKSTDLCQKIKNLSQRWLTVGGGEDLSLRRTFSMSWTSGCLRRKSLWASTRCGCWVPSSLSMAAVDSVDREREGEQRMGRLRMKSWRLKGPSNSIFFPKLFFIKKFLLITKIIFFKKRGQI